MGDLDSGWDAVEGSRVLGLEVDGPPTALEIVVSTVARRAPHAIVAVSMMGGDPPPWWVLDLLVANHVNVGLDLRDVRWHDDQGLWWTGPDGPTLLPLRIEAAAGAASSAKVLALASGTVRDSPVGRWLSKVGADEIRPARGMWDKVLCAQYAAMASDHLDRRVKPCSADDPFA